MELVMDHAEADALYEAWLAAARAMPYLEYLRTRWWAAVRDQALRRAGRRCQLCGGDSGGVVFHVHHNTYSRLGCELPADLICLCYICHDEYHRGLKP